MPLMTGTLINNYGISAMKKVEQTKGAVNHKRHQKPSDNQLSQFFSRISSVDSDVKNDWNNAENEKGD